MSLVVCACVNYCVCAPACVCLLCRDGGDGGPPRHLHSFLDLTQYLADRASMLRVFVNRTARARDAAAVGGKQLRRCASADREGGAGLLAVARSRGVLLANVLTHPRYRGVAAVLDGDVALTARGTYARVCVCWNCACLLVVRLCQHEGFVFGDGILHVVVGWCGLCVCLCVCVAGHFSSADYAPLLHKLSVYRTQYSGLLSRVKGVSAHIPNTVKASLKAALSACTAAFRCVSVCV